MKTVLITGASKGIGKATAERFLQEGYRVFGTSRSGDISISHPQFTALRLDLASKQSIASFSEQFEGATPSLDLLISNAGVGFDFGQVVPDPDSFEKTMEVNLNGTMFFNESVLDWVKKGGKVAFISSRMGSIGDCKGNDSVAYRVSKAALNMYVKILSNRLEATHRVACLHPGWVQTEIASMNTNAPLVPAESADKIYEYLSGDFANGSFWNIVTQEIQEW